MNLTGVSFGPPFSNRIDPERSRFCGFDTLFRRTFAVVYPGGDGERRMKRRYPPLTKKALIVFYRDRIA